MLKDKESKEQRLDREAREEAEKIDRLHKEAQKEHTPEEIAKEKEHTRIAKALVKAYEEANKKATEEIRQIKYVSKDYDCGAGDNPFIYFPTDIDLKIEKSLDIHPVHTRPIDNLVNAIEQFITDTYGTISTLKGDIIDSEFAGSKKFTLTIKDC